MKEEFEVFDMSELLKEEKPLAEGQQLLSQPLEQEEKASLESEAKAAATETATIAATPFFIGKERAGNGKLQMEQPYHRSIAIHLAQGYTPSEVAEMTGFSKPTVLNVKAQPWAQKYIAELMERAGRKVVMNELQGAALEAARLIVASVKGELAEHKPADRCKDAHKLLDRLYGQAPQTVLSGKVDPNDLSDEELAAGITHGTGNN